MESNQIYEPIKKYKNHYQKLHQDNVSEYFEELVKKANIDEEENRETIKIIKRKKSSYKKVEQKSNTYKGLKFALIIIMIISLIVSFYMIYNLIDSEPLIIMWADILIIIGLVLLFAGLFLLIRKKINLILKDLKMNLDELAKEIEEQVKRSWVQMAPLNRLFDWGISQELLTKTMPLVQMDKYFNPKRYDILQNKYHLWGNENINSSVLYCQSGEIIGNPFVIGKNLNTYMGTKTYTGSKTIVWTERVSDGQGGTRTVTRTQILTATISKPAPMYAETTFLVYANEAAPNLTFDREAKYWHKLPEKKLNRKIKKESQNIQQQARKSVTKGSNFTAMADEKFDVLFGALNRNHEVQFRLLFTPLAQREMTNVLLDDKVGFGDDFSFHKQKMLNTIMPMHLHEANIDANPEYFISNDIDISREKFNDYNNRYFKSIYFSFAPLLTIPLYQQHKSKEYIYRDNYPNNISPWEHEAVVNGFNKATLKHPLSATINILKTRFKRGISNADEVEVTAHGYEEIQQIEYVTKLGGDGRMHSIPVTWYRYDPVKQTSNVVIQTADDFSRPKYEEEKLSNKELNQFVEQKKGPQSDFIYKNRLIAYTADTKLNPLDIDYFNKLLYNKKGQKED